MRRVNAIKAAGEWDAAQSLDRVILDADERHRRRSVLTAERGTSFLLDLPRAAALHDGDGLVLDDGSIVRVVGRPEALVEVAAAEAVTLAEVVVVGCFFAREPSAHGSPPSCIAAQS